MAGSGPELNYSGKTDPELVRLAKAGDKEAEQALIERWTPLAQKKSRPYYLLGADKDDLVQEGLIGLMGAVRDFDPEKGVDFRPFAEACIINSMFAAIKRATRKKHMPLNDSVSLSEPVGGEDGSATLGDRLEQPGASSPEELVIMRESELSFARALENELTELELESLRLFLNGLSYKKIAERLGKTPKAVDNALQRVKRKAAALLKKEE